MTRKIEGETKMKWKHSKFDCFFSLYTSGEYEIMQCYEGGWQLSYQGYFVSHHNSLKDAKEMAEEHGKLY